MNRHTNISVNKATTATVNGNELASLWERSVVGRFDINGYREEGTTTTPFDMQVRNKTSRYHLVIQAAQKMAARNPKAADLAEALVVKYERQIMDHRLFIRQEGNDPAEITEWRWRDKRVG